MSKLDTDLAEIIVRISRELPTNWSLADIDKFVEEIKKAFKGDGYVDVTYMQSSGIPRMFGYLLSGEWLTRFKTELETMQPLMSPDGYEKFKKAALAVAERAAK